jgi:hypothetical protein
VNPTSGPYRIMNSQCPSSNTLTATTMVRHQMVPRSPTVMTSVTPHFVLPGHTTTMAPATVVQRAPLTQVYTMADPNTLSFAGTPVTFTSPTTVQNILISTDNKDQLANLVQNVQLRTYNGPTFPGKSMEARKQAAIEEIAASLADDKHDLPSVSYQAETPSPASSNQSLTTHVMRTLSAENVNDTMLSAINLSVDEALLTSGNVNTLTVTPSTTTFDLFDANSNMSEYNIDSQLSPQSYTDNASNFNLPGGATGLAAAGQENTGQSEGPHQSGPQSSGASSSSDGSETAREMAAPAAPVERRGKGRPAKQNNGTRPGVHCAVCGKSFNNSSALAKHKLTHSEERKYGCPICSKAFKRQDHLNGHMMTHRSKKPFECKFDGCDKSYCDARSLRRHLENHHQHTLEGVAAGTVPPGVAVDGADGYRYTGSTAQGGAGQYFQFGASYRQQILNNGDSNQFDGSQKSPGYLAQVSPVTPTSPRWSTAFNPLE